MKTKEEFQSQLGNNLRMIRVNQNWSIEKLAKESGITYNQVRRIELGDNNPNIYTVSLLTKSLNIPISKIFEGIDLVLVLKLLTGGGYSAFEASI